MFDWLFRDRRTDRVVIGQFPNLPMWIAMAFFGARWAVEAADGPSEVRSVLDWGFAAAIVWWAVLEIVQGVNPWRRGLGAVVLLMVVVGRLTR